MNASISAIFLYDLRWMNSYYWYFLFLLWVMCKLLDFFFKVNIYTVAISFYDDNNSRKERCIKYYLFLFVNLRLVKTSREGSDMIKSTNMHINLCPLASGVGSGLCCSFEPLAHWH